MSEAVTSLENSRLRLITCAPWLTAKRTPSAIVDASPSPWLLSTRTGMIRAPKASPVRPKRLLVASAIVAGDERPVAVVVVGVGVVRDEVIAATNS